MAGYLILNGKTLSRELFTLSPDNRSYRYGDGLFETIRVRNRFMPLWELHMDRMFKSLSILQFSIPTHLNAATLQNDIERLLQKNDLTNARVRISFYRGDGGITDPVSQHCGYVIQTWPINPETLGFNTNGLHIGIYPDAYKSTDFLSNLKSANYLPYVMASLYAKKHKWNEALVLNHHGRIADSCIANVFWIKQGQMFTNPLTEGGVDGVMRKYILHNQIVTEKPLYKEELMEADEIFLTNAVKGIQWVGMLEDKRLQPPMKTIALYRDLIKPLFG